MSFFCMIQPETYEQKDSNVLFLYDCHTDITVID